VREIVHQLRFRNIGGLIILDLIDMEVAANREKVYRALVDALREDKSKVNLLKISELGLVEMTRKRTRESLTQQLCEPCPVCEGKGYLQSARTVAQKLFRNLPRAAGHLRGATLQLRVHPDVAMILRGEAAGDLERLAGRIGRSIEIEAVPAFHPEQFEIDSRGERVAVLPMRLAPEPEPEPEWHAEDLDADAEAESESEPDPRVAAGNGSAHEPEPGAEPAAAADLPEAEVTPGPEIARS
jgi:hypothetical protein